MKWFAITNREKKSENEFGDDPEKRGKIHFLRNETKALPKSNKGLKLKYVGASDDTDSTKIFVDEIKKELISMSQKLEKKQKKPTLLIYTHGYNNDYNDALEEYTQIRRNFHNSIGKKEFEEQCLLILFTWPSEGKVIQYLEDRDDARSSYPAISNLVHILLKTTNDLENCISNVSVIAHSMGNYVFREALSALTSSSYAPAGTIINQFIAIGADINNNSLEPNNKGRGITRFSDRVSVYFTPHDPTLSKSKRKNGKSRLGRKLSSHYQETPDNVVFIDCRDWANKKTLKKNEIDSSIHSSYRSVPAILTDMFITLCNVDREVISNREMITLNKLYKIKT